MAEMEIEAPQGFDKYYRDPSGRGPGDEGFQPPSADAFVMRDPVTGMVYFLTPRTIRAATLPYILPVYTDDYVDFQGRHVGDPGFVPPATVGMALPGLGYSEQYRGQGRAH